MESHFESATDNVENSVAAHLGVELDLNLIFGEMAGDQRDAPQCRWRRPSAFRAPSIAITDRVMWSRRMT